MPFALFGITNDGLNLFVNLVVLFLVVVWIALVVWTYLDARRRLSDPVLIGAATVASLFPFVGTIVYSILRPPEFLDDTRERELEIRASELRVRQLEEQSCPNCGFPIERSYLRCPSCKARVKDPCESCGKPIDLRWALCPYCEAPTRRAAQPPARRGQEARARAPRAAASGSARRRKPAGEGGRPADGSKAADGQRRAPQGTRPKKQAARTAASGRGGQQRAKGEPAPAREGGSNEDASRQGPTRESEAAPSAPEGGGEESPRPATT